MNNRTKDTESQAFRKTIDKTTYIVRVHFKEDAVETIEDKIKRLLRDEVRRL